MEDGRNAKPRAGVLRRAWRWGWVRWAVVLSVLLVLGWCLRVPILRGLGRFLITEDPVVHVDAVYVLGGSSLDRGMEAARIHRSGSHAPYIFTGGSVPADLEAMGIDMTESDCTRRVAVENGLSEAAAISLRVGTSTKEEADALLQRAIADRVDTVMVISTPFHLRRIGFVFRERFAEAGITVLLHGAPSSKYDEDRWWESEEGLLMVNNEYMKLLYYHLKY
ncbi:MAG: YdcF family protein [Flavobacteriales bacterium]